MSHLFITGFMGAGKSTVGRLVAERLGRPFADTDAVIEQREGLPVPELFAARGEDGFRLAEHAALEWLVSQPSHVVATGGGVVLRPDNQALLRQSGTVVYLSVTPEEALARLGDAGDRPLLAGGGLGAARSILEARLSLYRATADHVVETTGRTPSDVADAVLAALAEQPVRTIGVGVGDAAYEILLGPGLLDRAGVKVREVTGARRAAVVCDATVAALYGQRLTASLEAAGLQVSTHTIPPGETSKSWAQAGQLLEQFASAGLDRASVVVALGGGVVGDLAGFCAASYMRGVALVHVPTTLLAQVDSAIGGKTGVDLEEGKNLAGAFWPPRLVLADTAVLATLPPAEWTNGLVEAAKAALLAGGSALERFEGEVVPLMWREAGVVSAAVYDAAAFKAAVVTDDLREADRRECLNLGHTLGHALELLLGYGTISHGLAVAEGMRFAARLAERASASTPEVFERTRALLEAIGAGREMFLAALGPRVDTLSGETLLQAMKADKKSREGTVRFVLLTSPGKWEVRPMSDDVLLAALGEWASGLEAGGL